MGMFTGNDGFGEQEIRDKQERAAYEKEIKRLCDLVEKLEFQIERQSDGLTPFEQALEIIFDNKLQNEMLEYLRIHPTKPDKDRS